MILLCVLECKNVAKGIVFLHNFVKISNLFLNGECLILFINMRGSCYEKERRESKINGPYFILKFCEAIELHSTWTD